MDELENSYKKKLFITIGDTSDINTYLSVHYFAKFCKLNNDNEDKQIKYDMMNIITQRKGIINYDDIKDNNEEEDIYRNELNKGYNYDSDTYKSEYIMEITAKTLQLIYNQAVDSDDNSKNTGGGKKQNYTFILSENSPESTPRAKSPLVVPETKDSELSPQLVPHTQWAKQRELKKLEVKGEGEEVEEEGKGEGDAGSESELEGEGEGEREAAAVEEFKLTDEMESSIRELYNKIYLNRLASIFDRNRINNDNCFKIIKGEYSNYIKNKKDYNFFIIIMKNLYYLTLYYQVKNIDDNKYFLDIDKIVKKKKGGGKEEEEEELVNKKCEILIKIFVNSSGFIINEELKDNDFNEFLKEKELYISKLKEINKQCELNITNFNKKFIKEKRRLEKEEKEEREKEEREKEEREEEEREKEEREEELVKNIFKFIKLYIAYIYNLFYILLSIGINDFIKNKSILKTNNDEIYLIIKAFKENLLNYTIFKINNIENYKKFLEIYNNGVNFSPVLNVKYNYLNLKLKSIINKINTNIIKDLLKLNEKKKKQKKNKLKKKKKIKKY